jgi:hypothetical protein
MRLIAPGGQTHAENELFHHQPRLATTRFKPQISVEQRFHMADEFSHGEPFAR